MMYNFAPGYGMRICSARRTRNMTQIDLGKAAGVGQISISHWENEKTKLNAESWHRLATALQVSEHWLRHGTEAPVIFPSSHDLSQIPIEALFLELNKRGYSVMRAFVPPLIDVKST